MFCPFVNGECVKECVFYEYKYNSKNCKLVNTVDHICSDGFDYSEHYDGLEDITPRYFLHNIISSLNEIKTKIDDINGK